MKIIRYRVEIAGESRVVSFSSKQEKSRIIAKYHQLYMHGGLGNLLDDYRVTQIT